MQVVQELWTEKGGWISRSNNRLEEPADLVLVFGAPHLLEREEPLSQVRRRHREAVVCAVSTAGEISNAGVEDAAVVATAVRFEKTVVRAREIRLRDFAGSFQAGYSLAAKLPQEGLAHVLVFSDGLAVNGTQLAAGLRERLPSGVAVTGGLAADGDRFVRTLVGLDGQPEPGTVVAIGFYGGQLAVGFGSVGGWDPFGPERRVTRARDNVLFELDGASALGIYRRYLGDHARHLPASGLLFPLSIRESREAAPVVRTILSVDDRAESMTFAGDIPVGSYARLMKANFDRLIDGAASAAEASCRRIGSFRSDLALLISCVGRKLVLKQRVDEEVEGVRAALGDGPLLAGFYSYGEISPLVEGQGCQLHNQTMTVTLLAEA
jgi:hypothetical protein